MSQPHPLPETLKAATGVVELLLATDLSLEQKHYALALARLLAGDVKTFAPSTQEITYIDREVLAELYRYLPKSGCAAILEQFRGTAEQLMADAARALTTEDADALARTAHSLIGTVGAVGMGPMAQEARAIVIALRQGDWTCAAERAAALPALYSASTAALDGVIATLNDSSH